MAITKPVGDLPLEHIPIRLWLAGQMMPATLGFHAWEVEDCALDAAEIALQYADALLETYTQEGNE